ncbi:single insulin-like growth factor-binding domain protein-2 [Macrobrachium nipponense]|uniref:single insulin-like growth factor-binding domain protein-2 n=1 Tax=Macrobrachium nipponense TaxID=159736 RepID=UPI0030C8A56D
MDFKIVVAIASVFCLIGSTTHALRCSPCQKDESRCPRGNLTESDCPYGVTTDICNCCDVCAKGPGEACGGLWNQLGKCGPEYTCVPVEGGDAQEPFFDGKCE